MKKTFKSLLSLLIVAILAASVFAFNVSAASTTLSGTGEYEVGKSFSVTVRYSADFTLYSVEADVSYNSSVLRLDGVSGADYNPGNGTVKIVDTNFSATKKSTTSSYTLNFTAIAAGNSSISATVLGAGNDDNGSDKSATAASSSMVSVVTPKPSSNANLASIKLSSGSLSPAFNANTTNYTATVKFGVDSITVTGSVADGGATYVGGGTFALNVGENVRTLTVTAADGTKKSYTVNIKRMTEEETAEAEQAARDANPLLVTIDGEDYTIVNNFDGIAIPTGFTQTTVMRKGSEITVLSDVSGIGKYQLCYLVDVNGENGAFYSRDDDDNFTKLTYISVNNIMYIIEKLDIDGAIPSGYKQSTYMIDGVEVEMVAYEDEMLSEFAIFNCYVTGASENAMYCYDTIEGTMQRGLDFTAALAHRENDDTVDQSTGQFAWFTDMSKTGKAVFLIIVFAAVVLIAVAVILIVKISSAKDYGEDGYILDTNNDFILNDFAKETEDEQSKELQDKTEN